MLAANSLARSRPDGQTVSAVEPSNPATFWRLLGIALLLLTCGGSAARPVASSAHSGAASASLVGCPPAASRPLPGSTPLALPCLSRGDVRVPVGAVSGRPQVINLWASWCAPCRQEMPMLQSAHQAYGDRVLFVGVDTRDDRGAALRFLGRFGTTYPQVFDSSARLASTAGVLGLPYTMILSGSGKIVYRQSGTITAQTLRAALAEAGATAAPFG